VEDAQGMITNAASELFLYEPGEEILFVNSLANTKFDSKIIIDKVFEDIESYWKRHCNKKIYVVIDYTNVTIDLRWADYFSNWRTRVVRNCSHTAVRYGADLSTRAAMRAMAVKTHVPSNLYATREEAIAVVRGIRQGKIQVANTG
jgi:hypothetical protein